MPSVDRVGRYFPLTLACALEPGVDPFRLLSEPDWFEQAETLMLAVLEENCSVEAFDTLAGELGAPRVCARLTGSDSHLSATPEVPPLSEAVHVRPNAWHIGFASPAELDVVCPALLGRALDQVFCSYSLWWSIGSEQVAPSLLICQGLPPIDGFSALLEGNWSGRGWWALDPGEEPKPGGIPQ
jgi:type VI secretion system protein ImpM